MSKSTLKEDKMGTKNISSLLLEFSIPAMIGMMVNAIYNIVDRIFIGNAPHLGAPGLAAASITYPVTLILLSFGLLVGVGAATLFSISLGKKEAKKAENYLGQAVTLSIIAGIIFMVFGNILIRPLLTTLGASPEVLPLAEGYLSIILYGGVFQIIAIVLNNIVRADGAPKVTMVSMLIGAGFNIVFDYILIILLGWGMEGAALATVGGQFLSMIWQFNYFFNGKSQVKFKFKNMKLSPDITWDIIRVGTPAFLLQLANSFMTIMMNAQLVKYGGDVAVSVAGIVTSASTMVLMLISGLRQGMQPLISYNTGARKQDRVKETLLKGSIAGTVIALIGFVVIQLFPEFVIRLFNQDEAVLAIGVPAIRIWAISFPLDGVQMVWAGYFQAIGEVRLASFLNLLRQVIFLVPILFLLGPIFGLYGIFSSFPIAGILAAIVTGYFMWDRFIKKSQPWTNSPV